MIPDVLNKLPFVTPGADSEAEFIGIDTEAACLECVFAGAGDCEHRISVGVSVFARRVRLLGRGDFIAAGNTSHEVVDVPGEPHIDLEEWGAASEKFVGQLLGELGNGFVTVVMRIWGTMTNNDSALGADPFLIHHCLIEPFAFLLIESLVQIPLAVSMPRCVRILVFPGVKQKKCGVAKAYEVVCRSLVSGKVFQETVAEFAPHLMIAADIEDRLGTISAVTNLREWSTYHFHWHKGAVDIAAEDEKIAGTRFSRRQHPVENFALLVQGELQIGSEEEGEVRA